METQFGPSGAVMECNQCGLMHPPIGDGKCPLAKEKTKSGDEIELDKFFLALKNILIANIKKNNINDYKKLLAILLIKINKFVEKYCELKRSTTSL